MVAEIERPNFSKNLNPPIAFCSDDTSKIIQGLDPSKPHGHNMICILMPKICDEPISKHLETIFEYSIEKG